MSRPVDWSVLDKIVEMGFPVHIRRQGDCVRMTIGNYFGKRPLRIHDESASQCVAQLALLCPWLTDNTHNKDIERLTPGLFDLEDDEGGDPLLTHKPFVPPDSFSRT